MSTSTRSICAVVLSAVLAWTAGPTVDAHAKPPLASAIKRQQSRNEFTRFERVVDALDVAPGMTVLDIGAGPGYASFLFAEKLHGTGAVFATDIRRDFVEHIAEEAKKRGLDNLFPAVVKAEGLDEFYTRHRYDLVFLSNVYHCLDGRVEYFSKLRATLKDGARLALVLYNQVPLFSVEDFDDIGGLIQLLSGEDDDPFRRRLSPGTRQLLKDKAGSDALAGALVDDFNRMLVDPLFYREFYGNFYFRKDLLSPPERGLANWLLMTLHEDGVLERPADRIDAKAIRAVIKLNRLFFVKRFGDYLAEEGWGAYVPAGDANRHTSKYLALKELDAAGYRFDRELRLSPFFDAVIMVPKTP